MVENKIFKEKNSVCYESSAVNSKLSLSGLPQDLHCLRKSILIPCCLIVREVKGGPSG
jgi:hypothetical protein